MSLLGSLLQHDRVSHDDSAFMPATVHFISANPADTARLDTDEEARAIQQVLRAARLRDEFRFVYSPAARARDFQSGLLAHAPAIVHFGGHGQRGSETGARGSLAKFERASSPAPDALLVRGEDGLAVSVSTATLTRLFELLRGTRCVVLNACFSEAQARALAEHVPYVIGTTRAITDSDAIEFARAFYEALGAGEAPKKAFELGKNAVHDAGAMIDFWREGMAPEEIRIVELPVSWEPGQVIRRAWEILKVQRLLLIMACIVYILPFPLVYFVLPKGTSGELGPLSANLFRGIWQIGGAYFLSGLTRLYIAAARQEAPRFGDLLRCRTWLFPVLSADILLNLVALWPLFRVLELATEGGDNFFGKLAELTGLVQLARDPFSPSGWGHLMIPILFLFVRLRLFYAPHCIVDSGRGLVDSLVASWRMTRHQVGKLIVLTLFQILLLTCFSVFYIVAFYIILISVILLQIPFPAWLPILFIGIGLILWLSISWLADAIVYTRLSGRTGACRTSAAPRSAKTVGREA
ncbi:CHAT domain-containing protein [Sorangium sp. So ce117]|uniref:CHAT domain-containing protein n=1 Tax=Sorangium sp. So ce117 TaxID=3133277 RepID=UPI003F5DB779